MLWLTLGTLAIGVVTPLCALIRVVKGHTFCNPSYFGSSKIILLIILKFSPSCASVVMQCANGCR